MTAAACCLPSTALLVGTPPQKQVPQLLDSDSVSAHVENKAGVFPAAVFKLLCRKNVKQLQQNLRDSSMNPTFLCGLSQVPSELLLLIHSNKLIQKHPCTAVL